MPRTYRVTGFVNVEYRYEYFLAAGVTHNIPLLRDVLTEKTFNSGVFTTSYLPVSSVEF